MSLETGTAPVRAVVAHARDDVRVDRVPEPVPGPDEALVGIELGGICGSDLHYWLHGADRVALPARMLRPIPDALDPRAAALIEPLSVAWHAVKQAGEVAGRRVLVVGAGPIGALVVSVLAHHGAGEIVVTDLFEAPLQRALELGAHRALLASEAAELEGLDADIVIESSGSVPGLRTAIRAATRGGRVVMLGLLPPGDQATPLSTAIARELELVGSFRFNDEIDDVIAALSAGELDPSAVVTHVFDADQALEAFGVARDASTSGKVLLRFGNPE